MPIPDACGAPTRHMFAWLDSGWCSRLRADLDACHRQTIADWVDKDLPFVVARNVAGDAPNVVRLGLSLTNKTRIGLCLDRQAIRTLQQPPLLDAARRVAPPAWNGTIDAVLEEARHHDISARTYGSLAWQAMTSLDYLRPSSDLDLLLVGGRWSAIERLSRRLQGVAGPPRLDGEVLLHDGAGIAWREIAHGNPTLLVKTQHAVLMLSRADISKTYADRAA